MGLFFPDYGTSFRKSGGQKYPLIEVAATDAALFGLITIAAPAEHLSNLTRPFSAQLIESPPKLAPRFPPSSTAEIDTAPRIDSTKLDDILAVLQRAGGAQVAFVPPQ